MGLTTLLTNSQGRDFGPYLFINIFMIHPIFRTSYLPPVEFIETLPEIQVDISKLCQEFSIIEPFITVKSTIQHKIAILDKFKWNELSERIPYTTTVCEKLKKYLPYNSIYYRKVMPNTCYNWHSDSMKTCLHIPIITNSGCKFVYEDRVFSMPADGSVYVVNNDKFHTFMNAGNQPRVHITLDIF